MRSIRIVRAFLSFSLFQSLVKIEFYQDPNQTSQPALSKSVSSGTFTGKSNLSAWFRQANLEIEFCSCSRMRKGPDHSFLQFQLDLFFRPIGSCWDHQKRLTKCPRTLVTVHQGSCNKKRIVYVSLVQYKYAFRNTWYSMS